MNSEMHGMMGTYDIIYCMPKKKINTEICIEEALKNIQHDRSKLSVFVDVFFSEMPMGIELKKRIAENPQLAMGIAKFFEVLQKNNDQYLKLIQILQKDDKYDNLSDEDKEELLDALQEENSERKD